MAKKVEYTALFLEFWKHYPRKVAKGPAFDAWRKQVDEEDAFMPRAVIDDVQKRTRLRFWPADKTKVPHAATWLNARRWEDENWEEEIKTRGAQDEPAPAASRRIPPPESIEADYGLDGWQQMQNRIMTHYLLAALGVSDEVLEKLVTAKNRVYADMARAIREEIEAAEGQHAKKLARQQMATDLASVMLAEFDKITGLSLADRVTQNSKRMKRAA